MSTSAPTPNAPRQMTVDWQPFDMVSHTKLWFGISIIAILIGLLYTGLNQMKYGAPFRMGIDFTGGTLVSFTYDGDTAQALNPTKIEEIVRNVDKQAPTVQISEGQNGQRTVLIRASAALAGADGHENLSQLFKSLEAEYGAPMPQTRSISEVSATISGELVRKAIQGLIWGNLLVFLYVTIRMRIDFAVFGIMALVHDVIITTGFMAITSYHFGWEVNSWFVAVLLTIVGFSINDTIVIYDRIRENLQLHPGADFPKLVNYSLIQTLTRSIYTSLTVWLVLTAMLVGQMLMGGVGGLKEFNAVMLAGMVAGTYSSIFIAAQALVAYYRRRERLGLGGFQNKKAEGDIQLPHRDSPVIAQMERLVDDAVDENTETPGNGFSPRKTVKGADILGKVRPANAPTASGTRPKKKRW